MKKKKKNQKVQSETHLQGMGCFVRKGFVLGVECLLNCFPHSVPHRPNITTPMCSARRGAGHRGHWRCDLAQLCSLCPSLHSPALHIPHSSSAVRNCTTFRISSFSTDSCHPLLPVPNESFGTKPVKTGKGYASGDVGKQVATFRELKLSFSCD